MMTSLPPCCFHPASGYIVVSRLNEMRLVDPATGVVLTTFNIPYASKLFITPEAYAEYTRRGGTLLVLQRSRLVALCLNPTSPQGYTLNSAEACQQLSEALQCPVYDVMKCPQP